VEHVGVKDAPFHGGDSFASESGCLQHTASFTLRFEHSERLQHHRPTTVTITQEYALPTDPDFQQPSAVFNGEIRSLTLGLKPVFYERTRLVTEGGRSLGADSGVSSIFIFIIELRRKFRLFI
jgi:hypothetical protein